MGILFKLETAAVSGSDRVPLSPSTVNMRTRWQAGRPGRPVACHLDPGGPPSGPFGSFARGTACLSNTPECMDPVPENGAGATPRARGRRIQVSRSVPPSLLRVRCGAGGTSSPVCTSSRCWSTTTADPLGVAVLVPRQPEWDPQPPPRALPKARRTQYRRDG